METPGAPKNGNRERVRQLCLEDGRKPREVAEILGISTQAVYQHLQRIRAQAAASQRAVS